MKGGSQAQINGQTAAQWISIVITVLAPQLCVGIVCKGGGQQDVDWCDTALGPATAVISTLRGGH